MRHGKFQAPRRRISPAIWVVLILAVLGISIGGVRAYLSYSAGEVNNLFTADMNPTVTVGKDYKVKVTADYAVYLRAAIVVNWKSGSGKLLAVQPEGYSLTPGEGWVKHKDGFYYYRKAVNKGDEIPPVVRQLHLLAKIPSITRRTTRWQPMWPCRQFRRWVPPIRVIHPR